MTFKFSFSQEGKQPKARAPRAGEFPGSALGTLRPETLGWKPTPSAPARGEATLSAGGGIAGTQRSEPTGQALTRSHRRAAPGSRCLRTKPHLGKQKPSLGDNRLSHRLAFFHFRLV